MLCCCVLCCVGVVLCVICLGFVFRVLCFCVVCCAARVVCCVLCVVYCMLCNVLCVVLFAALCAVRLCCLLCVMCVTCVVFCPTWSVLVKSLSCRICAQVSQSSAARTVCRPTVSKRAGTGRTSKGPQSGEVFGLGYYECWTKSIFT